MVSTHGFTPQGGTPTGSGEILDDSIVNADINSSAAIVGSKLAAATIDIDRLANGTDGELITWNSSGVAAAVAAGNSAQVLTSNGAGAAPTFQAAAGGENTATVVAGHASTQSLTEVELTTYSFSASDLAVGEKVIAFINASHNDPSNNGNLKIRINDGSTNLDLAITMGTNRTVTHQVTIQDNPRSNQMCELAGYGLDHTAQSTIITATSVDTTLAADWFTDAWTVSVRGDVDDNAKTLNVSWAVTKFTV